jgi:hypothetical protein
LFASVHGPSLAGKCALVVRRLCQFSGRLGNRVGAGLTPAPPTPPDVRVRIRRFATHPGNGGRSR